MTVALIIMTIIHSGDRARFESDYKMVLIIPLVCFLSKFRFFYHKRHEKGEEL